LRRKDIVLALALFSLVNASAPSWVDHGVNVTYTQGSSTMTYYVMSRTSADITYQLRTVSSSGTRMPTLSENSSADYGDFWFDTTLIYGGSTGDTFGDYRISDQSSQSYAGKTWDTESVQQTIQGATVTRVLDKQTGLVLKVSVDAPGQTIQDIVLTSEFLPAFDTPAQQPAAPPPQQNTTPTPPAANNTPPPSQPQQNQTQPSSPPAQPYQPSGGSTSGSQPIGNVQPYSTSSPFCCSSAFILGLIGMVAVLRPR
jgi:hypothetical protein